MRSFFVLRRPGWSTGPALVALSLAVACGSSAPGYETPDPADDGGSAGSEQDADGGTTTTHPRPGQDGAVAPADGAQLPAEAGPADDGGMANWTPTAKGIWIWYFDYVGMTAAQAAQKAKDAGIGYVLIKSGQDASFWTTRYTPEAVNEFTSRGMRVFAWPYFTPDDVDGDITAAASAANVPGTSGLVLDVEVEWETGSHSADAEKLCKGIRTQVPGVWLGYTTFGWAGLHGDFPFTAFDTYCGDSAWPQVYYSDRGVSWDGSKGISQAKSQYLAANLKAPMWPIQSNDDVYQTTSGPTVAQLNGFFDSAGPYASLWEFPEASRTDKLDQLASLHWQN